MAPRCTRRDHLYGAETGRYGISHVSATESGFSPLSTPVGADTQTRHAFHSRQWRGSSTCLRTKHPFSAGRWRAARVPRADSSGARLALQPRLRTEAGGLAPAATHRIVRLHRCLPAARCGIRICAPPRPVATRSPDRCCGGDPDADGRDPRDAFATARRVPRALRPRATQSPRLSRVSRRISGDPLARRSL